MKDIRVKLLENVGDLAQLQPGDVICNKYEGLKVVMHNEEGTITILELDCSENKINEQRLKPYGNSAWPDKFYNNVQLYDDTLAVFAAEPLNPEYQSRDKILRDAGL